MPTSNRPSARTTWSLGQRLIVLLLAIAAAWAWTKDPKLFLWGVDLLMLAAFALVVLVKLGSIVAGLLLHDMEDASPEEMAALTDLPVYTILVPMYREPEMVAPMLESLARLDYPSEKLDVKLLLEVDDEATQAATAAIALPAWLSVIVAPEGKPKTKPRACNFGLAEASGEFLVIFDAEDRPDPDQLKKAVASFRRSPQVHCLQACLNYYNSRQNLLTRWFTLEYSTWFDLFLPGLHSLRSPIPLGGTSNHFRTESLRQLGGWDAWNVTEDCDLGMQMAREGLETRVLNATTWEEAVSRVPIWLRQRSRWVKGYWQTLLVHSRQPLRGLQEFGLWRYIMLWLVVGGHVLALALQPFCWLRVLISLIKGEAIFHPTSPHTLYLYVAVVLLAACNMLFILVHAIAAWQRGQSRLWLAALGLPIYWVLMSWAAWKGILQHFWAPFRWEKTTHGMAEVAESTSAWQPEEAMRSPQSRGISLLVIGGAMALLLTVAMGLPKLLNFQHAIDVATLNFNDAAAELEVEVEENWQKQETLRVHVALADHIDPDSTVFKAIVHLKVGDGLWYQQHTENCVRQGNRVLVQADLTGNWQARDSKQPWGPWCLRRVRAAGLKLYTHEDDARVLLQELQLFPSPGPEPPLAADMITIVAAGAQNTLLEQRFALSRDYKNPYDPRQIDIAMEVEAPSGQKNRAIAFYFQDFARHYEGRSEILTATAEPPEWRVRFTPREVGMHRWRLQGQDHHGDTLNTAWQELDVSPSEASGFIRVDPDDSRFFAYENGDFFFPIGMNLRSPGDNIQPTDRDFRKPLPQEGVRLMKGYLDQMGKAGINVARIWMAPWFGGIEWNKTVPGYHGLGQYNLKNARLLDWILEHARSHNIVVDLALQNHGPFASYYDMQWDENPYNHELGGPLKRRVNVLMDQEARRLFEQRFRYVAARWGSDPTIFAWTAWIEVDALRAPYRYVRSWHKDVIPRLNAFDLGRHPVSTLYSGNEGDLEVWKLPEIDFTQFAAYAEYYGAVDRFEQVAEFAPQFGKPVIIEEYGGSAVAGEMDATAQQIHDGLWAGLMQPLAGAPYAWWWNLVFAKNLERFHATAAKFVGNTDLRGKRWRYANLKLKGDLRAAVRQSQTLAWAWVYDDAHSNLRARTKGLSGFNWPDIARVHGNAYQRLVGDRYDPLTATEPDRFDAVRGATLTLDGLQPGSYTMEFWETWGSETVSKHPVQIAGDRQLRIKLPPLNRDIAIRVQLNAEAR